MADAHPPVTSAIPTTTSRGTVLVIAEFGSLNGGENSFLTVASALAQHGWRFIVTAPSGSPLQSACEGRKLGTVDFRFHDANGTRKPLDALRVELAELIRHQAPDIVHCNSLSTSRITGPVTRQLQVPALGYLRDIIKLNRRVISDINQLNRIIAVSDATRNFHRSQGLDPSRSRTIYNGLELGHFCPPPKRDFDPPNRLLFVGQLGMRKGIDVLLQALADLPRELPCILDLVGERHSRKQEAIEYEQALRTQAALIHQHTPHQVTFAGRQPDIAERMRSAHLLVHPAHQEPLGRVLLEACASGLPAIATHVGGTPEIFADLKDWELLCAPASPRQLTQRIQRFLTRPLDEKRQLERRVRQIAETRFPVERTAEALAAEYKRLLARPGGPA